MSHALVYDGQNVPENLELSRVCIGAVDKNSPVVSKASEPASLGSLVKIIDCPEHRDSLLTLLRKYREVIALPGESLGATDKAEHHVKLKFETKPLYVPTYRLLQSQKKIVDE